MCHLHVVCCLTLYDSPFYSLLSIFSHLPFHSPDHLHLPCRGQEPCAFLLMRSQALWPRTILSHHLKPLKWRISCTLFKLGKTSNKDTETALETSYPKTCDLLFFSACVSQILKELTSQQHLFPDYTQMRAHILTVIKSRAHGPAPMMMGKFEQRGQR